MPDLVGEWVSDSISAVNNSDVIEDAHRGVRGSANFNDEGWPTKAGGLASISALVDTMWTPHQKRRGPPSGGHLVTL
jgi:hypothetical protein